jgi:hypothetical protein
MSRTRACVGIYLLLIACLLPGLAQQPATAGNAIVPPMVKFSGTLTDANGKPLTELVGVSFLLYKDSQGGAPLWMESQNVQPDKSGHYSVMLGSGSSQGLPPDLFVSGEARWLGVQAQGQAEQPRTVLLSVPYALKAADAATIGGLPPSAFVLAPPAKSDSSATPSSSESNSNSNPPALGGSGKPNFLPLWTKSTTLGNSVLFQSGTGAKAKVGIGTTKPASTLDVNGGGTIRGLFSLPATGTATASAGFNSQPMDMVSSVFNSATNTAVPQTFQWLAEPVGNNTNKATGSLNLLFAQGGGKPSETGLNIASNGQITFAAGQTFPGVGNGTITGVTAGNDLTGGGTSGNVTLNLDTTKVPLLGSANTFAVNQTVNGTMAATSFSGDGSGLSNVNAAGLNGLTAGLFSQLGQSNTYQSSPLGTAIPQVLGPVNNATASGGFNSNPEDLGASVFNSGSSSAQKETFRWQAEPVGNNTSSPSGKLDLLFGANGVTPAETGLSLASNGQVTFAPGQSFPGAGTITGVTTASGSGLMGGGTSGPLNLALTNTCASNQVLQWNGSAWVCGTVGVGTVTSVGLSAPVSDFTVSGSPITSSGTLGLAWNVPPDTNNTPNAIVKRDVKGDFSADGVFAFSIAATNVGAVSVRAFDPTGQANLAVYGSTGYPGIGIPSMGVWGDTSGTGSNTNGPSAGVYGTAAGPNAYGVVGIDVDSNNNEAGVGVYGDGAVGVEAYSFAAQAFVATTDVSSTADTAVITNNGGGFPLYAAGTGGSMYLDANGNLHLSGVVEAAAKDFKIDHPLDPANKYLVHTSVESSEMMNIYTGNITTDAHGDATVQLPEWFEALNTDFRYQLTVIGQFAQAIVAREIQNHQFAIRTQRTRRKGLVAGYGRAPGCLR